MTEVTDDEDKRVIYMKLLLEYDCVKEVMLPHTCHIVEWVN